MAKKKSSVAEASLSEGDVTGTTTKARKSVL
nr:MAG TPA_asm: hypothetical protein [Bacteriophage sp.]